MAMILTVTSAQVASAQIPLNQISPSPTMTPSAVANSVA
jgi:hypothetical protein